MEKDRPLLLRKRQDGSLDLDTRFCDSFPPRHEFSVKWLLENGRVVTMDDETIALTLGNASAVYRIERGLMEEEYLDDEGQTKTRQLSTGYWGTLESQDLPAPGPQDLATAPNPEA